MIKLIPEISKKINEVLKKKGLFPLESPQEFIKKTKKRKHRYCSVCLDNKGKKYIFYARLHDSQYEKERMRIEVKIAKVLIKKRKKYSFFPKYFDAKIEKDFEWIQREYFKEGPLESKKEIEKLKRRLSKKEILKISKTLFGLLKIKISDFPFLKKFNLKKYKNLSKQIEKEKILSEEETKKLKKFLRENFKILKKENKYFCHDDLHIGNIILFDNKVKVIDLEGVKISNFAFDVCFLWARLWKERKVAREILKSFYNLLPKSKRKTFEILFRLNSLFIGFHSFMQTPKEYNLETMKKRKKFFLKMLKKALISFEELKKL
jgi:thiamine kinase-like enzyme